MATAGIARTGSVIYMAHRQLLMRTVEDIEIELK